jgi:hypothetical protein
VSLGIGEIEAFTRHRRLLVLRSPERAWPKGYDPNSSAALSCRNCGRGARRPLGVGQPS